MKLTVATPDRYLYSEEEVQEVTVTGHGGELNVLPGHSPLMTALIPGIMRITKSNGDEDSIAICWGYCQISPNGINILAESAERADEIDIEQVKSAKDEAEKALASSDLDESGFETYFKKLKREEVRYAFANMKDN